MNIQNKVIVITGGASGLGFEMAKAVTARGARVAIIDIDEEKLSSASESLAGAKGFRCNICNEQEVADTFAQIKAHFGNIDILVNNAGIISDAMLVSRRDSEQVKKLPLSKFTSVIDVNLTGSFLCAREAAGILVEQKTGGLIVNISSISRAGNMGQSNYSASKAAVVALTTTWANELARHQIRTAAIAPGFIQSDMTATIAAPVLQKLIKKIPAGRMGTAEEIAHGLTFIIENDFYNGRVLEIDGGMRI